ALWRSAARRQHRIGRATTTGTRRRTRAALGGKALPALAAPRHDRCLASRRTPILPATTVGRLKDGARAALPQATVIPPSLESRRAGHGWPALERSRGIRIRRRG